MLGLTIPDAIAFGSLCAAFLAASAGMLKSERGGRSASPERREPSPARGDDLAALSAAIADLAEAIRGTRSPHDGEVDRAALIRAILTALDAPARGDDGPTP